MLDLSESRAQIDVIDKEITRLFQKRIDVCRDVARLRQIAMTQCETTADAVFLKLSSCVSQDFRAWLVLSKHLFIILGLVCIHPLQTSIAQKQEV